MSSDLELKTWVSDKLTTPMGYSYSTVVQYVISKKAASGASLAGKLLECGLSSSAETRRFSEELFSKAPLKASGTSMYQKQEREAALLVKKQRSYAILEADEEDIEADAPSTAASSHSTKENSKRKRFRRTYNADEDEDDEEVKVQQKEEERVKRQTFIDDDSDAESDEEIRLDQREREQLEKNLRERDAAGTPNGAEDVKKEEEEAVRRSKALEEDSTDTLRKASRQEYLRKREQKKLDELRDAIEDEMYLFEGQKISETGICEFRLVALNLGALQP